MSLGSLSVRFCDSIVLVKDSSLKIWPFVSNSQLCLSKISKYLSGWRLYSLRNSIILADAHFSHDIPRNFILDLPFASCSSAREPGSAPPNRRASEVRGKTAEIDSSGPPVVDLPVPPLARLALGAGHRQARNSHCLASCQLSAVLDQGTGRPGWPRHTFQAQQLVSIDFFTVPTIRFQVLYVFLVLAHDRRRIHQGESADGILAYHTCEITNGRIDNVPLISAPDSHVLSPSFRLRPSSSNRIHAYRTLPMLR
jgi:hypothetical protein